MITNVFHLISTEYLAVWFVQCEWARTLIEEIIICVIHHYRPLILSSVWLYFEAILIAHIIVEIWDVVAQNFTTDVPIYWWNSIFKFGASTISALSLFLYRFDFILRQFWSFCSLRVLVWFSATLNQDALSQERENAIKLFVAFCIDFCSVRTDWTISNLFYFSTPLVRVIIIFDGPWVISSHNFGIKVTIENRYISQFDIWSTLAHALTNF